MNRTIRAGLAGLLLAIAAAAPAAAADVSVRVEGENATLLPRTVVTQPATQDAVTGCPPASASAALEIATKGNWDRQQFVSTILGETHTYSRNDYWNIWVFRGGKFVSGNGGCQELLAGGEEVLFLTQIADANGISTVYPTWITGVPATTKPGEAVTVTVNRAGCATTYCDPGDGTVAPLAGATVTGGSAPVTTDAAGKAVVTFTARGTAGLQATKTGFVRSATEPTCVTNGADGSCGTIAPDGTTLPPEIGGTVQPGQTPAVKDVDAPKGEITAIRNGQKFARKKAPRKLEAKVSDASGLLQVKISLTRQVGKRCWAFSRTAERFKRITCGEHPLFKVGDRSDVSYLLPKRLGKGRYVFDVIATDRQYNRDALARGRNRVVFEVR